MPRKHRKNKTNHVNRRQFFLLLLSFAAPSFARPSENKNVLAWKNLLDAIHIAISSQHKPPILLIVGSKNCHYCKDLISRIQKDPFFLKEDGYYIPAYVHIEDDFVPTYISEKATLYPSIFMLNYKGDIILGPIYGNITNVDLRNFLKEGLKSQYR